MLGSLLKQGVEITNDAASADALIVNTCSFIDAAQEESVDAILESAQLREARNRGQALIVSGCLPQRFRDELPAVLPEVDAFMGIDQVAQVSEVVQQALQHRAQRIFKNVSGQGRGRLVPEKRRVADKTQERGRPRPLLEDTRPSTLPALHSPRSPSSPLLDVNRRPSYIPDFATPRFRLTPRH